MNRLLTGMLTFLMTATTVAAPTEHEVKAAFLYNFAKFTEWPASEVGAGSTMNLCFTGNGRFKSALQKLQGRDVHGHTLNIRTLSDLANPDDCHMLFISASESRRLDRLLETIADKKGLLSISDASGFSNQGGMIELKVVDNRVRFAINLGAARKAGLNLSSKLLRLAAVVEE